MSVGRNQREEHIVKHPTNSLSFQSAQHCGIALSQSQPISSRASADCTFAETVSEWASTFVMWNAGRYFSIVRNHRQDGRARLLCAVVAHCALESGGKRSLDGAGHHDSKQKSHYSAENNVCCWLAALWLCAHIHSIAATAAWPGVVITMRGLRKQASRARCCWWTLIPKELRKAATMGTSNADIQILKITASVLAMDRACLRRVGFNWNFLDCKIEFRFQGNRQFNYQVKCNIL